jgi:hypothetical protein
MDIVSQIVEWTNENSGFLSLVLFTATIIYGWTSGIFQSLRKKPKFKVRVIDKMTFYSIYPTGEELKQEHLNETFELYKIAFAIYMEIVNVGTSPSTLGKVRIGYYPNKPRREFFPKRNWIVQTNCLGDFRIPLKDESQVLINHLYQPSVIQPFVQTDSYLDIGKNKIGVGYFEQDNAWGNANPREEPDGLYDIKIEIKDMWGTKHYHKTRIKKISVEDALKYNPRFGQTLVNF